MPLILTMIPFPCVSTCCSRWINRRPTHTQMPPLRVVSENIGLSSLRFCI